MRIYINDQELIRTQKDAQKICIDFLGKGVFSVEELEGIVKILQNTDKELRENCQTKRKINVLSCGGTYNVVEMPIVTQSKLCLNNQKLVNALLLNIKIAKTNDLKTLLILVFQKFKF